MRLSHKIPEVYVQVMQRSMNEKQVKAAGGIFEIASSTILDAEKYFTGRLGKKCRDLYSPEMRGEKTRIIIIDDEEDLCFILSKMLSDLGFEVSAHYTLKSGLEAIGRQRPEWVILDNNLPDGLGWERSQQILDSAPDLRLINISANPDSAHDISNPRVSYLIKPIEVSSIMGIIRAEA
jgi:two-component system, OmpR family, response regulator